MRPDGAGPRAARGLAMLLAAALALAACEAKDKDYDARMAALRGRLGALLHDYPSARFQDVHVKVYPTGQGMATLVCGKVDAKNEYGVFPGFQRFALSTDPAIEPRIGEHAAHEGGETDYYLRICDFPGKGWSQEDRSSEVKFRP
jgi:hypothetical protein